MIGSGVARAGEWSAPPVDDGMDFDAAAPRLAPVTLKCSPFFARCQRLDYNCVLLISTSVGSPHSAPIASKTARHTA
jgi:hypothetical protein